ncbi:MAG: GNAT family N-acetyltransferase [Comamonadaceae bacterium]
MQIRRLLSSDATEYRALRLRALHDHPEAFTSCYEEEVLKPLASSEQRLADASPVKFWGAIVDGKLVGTVGLDREQRLKVQHKALVIGMYVAPEYARCGIAHALLHTLLADARASHLELLVLTVTSGNQGAERLYLDAGFVSWGIEPGAIKVQHQRFSKNHMFLQLAAP